MPTCCIFPALTQDYYGNVLKNTADLKSNACVAPAKPIPAFIRQALKKVHPEVTARSPCCYAVTLLFSCCSRCVYTATQMLTVGVLLPQVLRLWTGGAWESGGLQDTGPGQWERQGLLHAESAGGREGPCHWHWHDWGPGTVHHAVSVWLQWTVNGV